MTSINPRHMSRMTTGLALTASIITAGLMINPADASTRVNESGYRMSKAGMINLCTSRNAAVHCPTSRISCACDDGRFLWTYRPPTQRNQRNVIRTPSPSRTSVGGLDGGEGGGVSGGGGGGTGGKP